MGRVKPPNVNGFSVSVLVLYWDTVHSTREDEEVSLSATVLLQLQKHCMGVWGGGRRGCLRSHSCVKHLVTLTGKHVDSSGVLGRVNGARVTLVFTSPHPPTLDNEPRFLDFVLRWQI